MLPIRRIALTALTCIAALPAAAHADSGHSITAALHGDPLAQAQTLVNQAQSKAVRDQGDLIDTTQELRKASPRFAALADREHLRVQVTAGKQVVVKLGLPVSVRDIAVVQMRFVLA
jgi:hypothetical protein